MSLYSGIPRYASFGRVNIESERNRTMFENYLCINGKKVGLTDEQMRQLGITPVESEIAKMSLKQEKQKITIMYTTLL